MMKKVFCFLIIAFSFARAWATPVTSAYYAKKWIDARCQEYEEEEKKAFLLGALFPEFAYLQVTLPTKPSEDECTFENLKNGQTPFECGRIFHELFYRFRERVIASSDVYANLVTPSSEDKELLLKLLEDEAYHDDIDVKYIKNCLYEVTEDEEMTGVPYHTLRTCHRLLSQYYAMTPNSVLRRLRQFNMGLFGVSRGTVSEWAQAFPNLLESSAFQCYLADIDFGFKQEFLHCEQ